jgi:hypothetical protein
VNLEYKILWYDDDQNFYESLDKEPIKEKIAAWGFLPNIVPVHIAAELQKHKPFNQFDMLVVDFDLGGEEYGDQFIMDVRNQEVFSEIIFYSIKESSALWRAVSEKQLEGIFVANKRSIESKLIQVAYQSVRKVLDLENMRGIVMSEVGDLDELLEKIFILAMHGITQDQQKTVFQGFIQKCKEPDEDFERALRAFEAEPSIEKLLRLCDSSDKRVQNLNRVKRCHSLLKDRAFVGDYQAEILSPRNFLAHGIADKNTDGNFVFRHRGKEYSFNDEVSRTLRKKILDYKSTFSAIAEELAQEQRAT